MAAYQSALDRLTASGIAVIAASTDARADAEGTRDQLGLGFPVAYGLPLHDTARALGAFYEERRGILHATAFLVRPDHTIGVATYSSGAIGRLDVEDVLRLVAFWDR